MKRLPISYQSEEKSKDFVMTTRDSKLGNFLYCVEYCNIDGTSDCAFFEHLSSALDFIHSNFN